MSELYFFYHKDRVGSSSQMIWKIVILIMIAIKTRNQVACRVYKGQYR